MDNSFLQKEIVFYKPWFKRNQEWLLRFANTSIGRHILRIHGNRSSIGTGRVLKIEPNSIHWDNSNGQHVAEYRTHAKFARRLYYGLKPLWKGMHIWDTIVANRLLPTLNLGFDTLPFYPDADPESTSVDGFVGAIDAAGSSWSDIHSGSPAVGSNDSAGDTYASRIQSYTTTDEYSHIYRGIFLFDTSDLPDTCTIQSATMSLSQLDNAIFHKDEWEGTDPPMATGLYGCNPDSNTSLTGSDYNTIGTTQYSDTTFAAGDTTQGAYNDYTLNSSGISAISKTGITKFATREANYDATNTEPEWESDKEYDWLVDAAEETGDSKDPKLVVTYTASATTYSPTCTAVASIRKGAVQLLATLGHIKNCVPAKTVQVSPTHLSQSTSSVTFVWEVPTDCKNRNVHAHIQVDGTDNTFGDLEENLFSFRDSGFEYWNGVAWVEYPAAGVTGTYYGNQARITLSLTEGTKFWRVRGGVK